MRRCNGICMTGYDIGVPSAAIAYPHPDCELHGYDAGLIENFDDVPQHPVDGM